MISILWVVILLWAIAVFIGYQAFPSFINLFKQPVDIESVDFNGDIEGLYVKATLYGIYDCYCEETKDSKVISREYLIDADDYYYIGLRAQNSAMDPADELMEASWDYLDGYTEYTDLEKYQYEVTGVLKKIPSDSLKFYYDYRDWLELDEEYEDSFLPYYLDTNMLGTYSRGGTIAMTLIFAVLLGTGLYLLINALSGGYQKSIKKYIANSANPDMARERVENFFQNTPENNGLRYNSEFISGQANPTTIFGETKKLAWVYLHTTTHKRNFITVGTTYALVLCFADGSRQEVVVKNEAIAQEHMKNLAALCPQTIFGYSDELSKKFQKDLSGFLSLRYNEQVANL